jgi:hypothetical protein
VVGYGERGHLELARDGFYEFSGFSVVVENAASAVKKRVFGMVVKMDEFRAH